MTSRQKTADNSSTRVSAPLQSSQARSRLLRFCLEQKLVSRGFPDLSRTGSLPGSPHRLQASPRCMHPFLQPPSGLSGPPLTVAQVLPCSRQRSALTLHSPPRAAHRETVSQAGACTAGTPVHGPHRSQPSPAAYLLCVLRLLFTWPWPVQPGVGHLSTFSCMANTARQPGAAGEHHLPRGMPESQARLTQATPPPMAALASLRQKPAQPYNLPPLNLMVTITAPRLEARTAFLLLSPQNADSGRSPAPGPGLPSCVSVPVAGFQGP